LGLKEQEKVQLLLTSGLNPSSEEFHEALEGLNEAWESYFDELPKTGIDYWGEESEIDHNTPLTGLILDSPTHPVSQMLLYLYSLDSWLFSQLNSGSREGDQAKVDTLGPYAYAFGYVIAGAASSREDIPEMRKLLEVTGTTLYRGTGLTKKEIKKYKSLEGKKLCWCCGPPALMTLTGYTSTTMIRSIAQKFTWSNEETGHEATLFEIMWKRWDGYYLMDMSAFPDEKEVLLVDGCKFEVITVDTTQDQNGKPLNVVTLKC